MPDTVIYCDGLCEPINPGGTACYGWVIFWQGKRAREGFGFICDGPGATNNLAEYTAVIEAMQYLLSKNFKGEIEIHSDSQLVINQLAGIWQVRASSIIPLFLRAKELAGQFQQVHYHWIPREKNIDADMLSRKAYHGHFQNRHIELQAD